MSFPLVISFYTKETGYQLEVQNLIESCRLFEIESHIEGIPSFGSWELNCSYKPFFIHQKLKEFKRPLFWVDADGVFVQKPRFLPQFNADLSVRSHEEYPPNHPSRVITSGIFINYTEPAVRIIRSWAEECRRQITHPDRNEEFWDQIALRDVLLREDHGAVVAPLPLSYAKIVDHPLDEKEILDPVIEQYQASRRFKKLILTEKILP